ncbi:ATP F0F1 synthase subunit alpha [Mycoplasma sp. NEAQ87857]|uniref:MSC_0619 family F1-like ATPase alpha subunit n=1 Tax=Mycoplasma sp. NEAQ87857 TaxID=2683967 RepID=UPI0013174BFE|nr:ATP F0F1 synthase subunit alpha [Mycoplasma sp. NEAQ87857]QGZ97914.1 ATP F0F1 synthase subunit alpha [Mycoplasma sp. NEAQ87857]
MKANSKLPVISAIFDYVLELTGEFNYKQNQLFQLVNDNQGHKLLLVSATKTKAYCLFNGDITQSLIGQAVEPIAFEGVIKTNKNIFGTILNISNQVLFPNNYQLSDSYYQTESRIFNKPNGLLEYQPLEEQLHTGYVSIDLLIPIGKGQRELIIGDRKTGKTHLALNTIINQKGKNIKCIYVAIGQQQSQVANIYQTLKQNGAMDYTFIIEATSSSPFDQFLAPYVGMAHAENIVSDSDVLIIFDDLSAHANIYREIALLTNKPVGKEAFPGDMFFAHSRLLERSGKFKGKKSITALPILQTIENDITSLIASNIISITDGQIVTNSELFALAKLPAVDIDLSVSRIGGNVQKAHISKVASEVGKIYKAYKRQIKLASLKYDLNDETNSLITNGALVENMFIQKGVSVYSEDTMFLTSKLIAWGVFKGVLDIPLALKFIDALIKVNATAREIFSNLLHQKQANDTLAKNYFTYRLDEFAKSQDLNWNIKPAAEFIPLSKDELATIIQKMEVK